MRSELKNGVRHLYDSPDITFGELLNKARKVELEDTETKGITKVQSKGAPVGEISPMSKLQQQVDQLTTLVKSAQVGPKRNTYKGKPKRNGNQNNDAPGDILRKEQKEDTRMQSKGPGMGPNGPFEPGQRPIQCYKCKGWGHPWQLCPSQLNFMRGECETESSPTARECSNANPTDSCSTEPIITKASQLAQRYHNPDPLLRLIGPSNEATVIVDGHEYPTLIDSGAQLTQMSLALVKTLELPIHALNTIIEAEPMGGGSVTYLAYVEVRLKVPGIKQMDKDSLFIVINDSPYTQRVPITTGTLHIRQALKLATEEEMKQLPKAWEVGNFPPITKRTSTKEPHLNLEEVRGKVTMTKDVTINPFDTIYVSGKTAFRKHSK